MCGFECIIKRITVSAKAEGIILDSSMVEHSAVNRGVVGSSPTRGAFCIKKQVRKTGKRKEKTGKNEQGQK